MTLSLPEVSLCSRLQRLLGSIDDLNYEVEELCLNKTDIKTNEEVEAVCEIVRKLPNLKIINLSKNQINDEQLVHLFQSLPLTLEVICLSRNRLTSKGIRYILMQSHRFKRLKSLYIYGYWNIKHTNELDFHSTLKTVDVNFNPSPSIQTLLRTKLIPIEKSVSNYRLKLRKFIWLVAKKKIDEFLLIELFHKLN